MRTSIFDRFLQIDAHKGHRVDPSLRHFHRTHPEILERVRSLVAWSGITKAMTIQAIVFEFSRNVLCPQLGVDPGDTSNK